LNDKISEIDDLAKAKKVKRATYGTIKKGKAF
jgi:hypothetical protein